MVVFLIVLRFIGILLFGGFILLVVSIVLLTIPFYIFYTDTFNFFNFRNLAVVIVQGEKRGNYHHF